MGNKKDILIPRKGYAEFLKSVLDKSESFKRNEENNSFIMAIDGSWGSGKTTFINEYKSQYNSDNTINIDINAWENDFWEEPFDVIFHSIYNNKSLFGLIKKPKNKDLKERLISAAKSIALGIAKKGVEKLVDSELLKVAGESLIDNSNKLNSIDEFEKFKDGVKDLKACLKELTELLDYTNGITIYIDELDRCKPTFAVKFLEIVKHLFNVNGLKFVFCLDLEQLEFSIQKIYGNIDANKYLNKFFDFISKIPLFTNREFITYLFSKNEKDAIPSEIKETFEKLTDIKQISLREIQTLYNNFKILYILKLNDYNNEALTIFYLSILYIKVIEPKVYADLIKGQFKKEQNEFLSKIKVILSIPAIEQINKNNLFKNLYFDGSYWGRTGVSFSNIEKDKIIFKDTYGDKLSWDGELNYISIDNITKILRF